MVTIFFLCFKNFRSTPFFSLYSGITTNGVISYNYSSTVTGSKSLQCKFDSNTGYNAVNSNITSLSICYFVDSGVTGDKNTNYLTTGGTQITTDTAGTKISCNTASNSYYIANVDLTGDFTVELIWVSGYWWDLRLSIFSTSNICINTFSHLLGAGYNKFITDNDAMTTQGSLNTNDKLKIIRTGTSFKFYQNGNLILSFTDTTTTVRFGFKTNSDASQSQKYKDLKIY